MRAVSKHQPDHLRFLMADAYGLDQDGRSQLLTAMDDALDRIEAAARRSVDHADPNTVAVMQRTWASRSTSGDGAGGLTTAKGSPPPCSDPQQQAGSSPALRVVRHGPQRSLACLRSPIRSRCHPARTFEAASGPSDCRASAKHASPKMNQRVASSLAVQPSWPRSDCNSLGS
jgi:hypothetical protein